MAPLMNPGGTVIESGLVLLLFLVLIADMSGKKGSDRWSNGMALGGVAVIALYAFLIRGESGTFWNGMVVIDETALWFKRLFLTSALLVLFMTRHGEEVLKKGRGAFHALLIVATLGMCLMASAHDFIALFLSLELVTISFYVLVAYSRDSIEAGLKYLIIGTVSAAVLLMGISFVYGSTGSLGFDDVTTAIASDSAEAPFPLMAGVILILLGVGFKVASVPFQSWAPDVYEGAPTPVVAFLSVGSKAAGFVVLQRLVFSIFLPIDAAWSLLILIVTPLTLFYGNLGAIPQTDIKRLLGYSSIAQAGYLLMGVASANLLGGVAMLYYLYAYLFSNLLAFLVVSIFYRSTGSFRIADFSGLNRRSPVLAGSMLIALLSLAGVPPLAGFFGKFLLIGSVLQAGIVWLAVVGVINVAIALYYYLIVVKMIYVRPPIDASPIAVGKGMKVILYLLMLAVLFLGLYQGPLMKISQRVSLELFGPQM